MPTDTERLDFLEEHLLRLTGAQATNTVYMGGERVFGELSTNYTGENRKTLRVCHKSIRDAVDEAMSLK